MIGRPNRLVFEAYVFEACQLEGSFESARCERIVFLGIRADKPYRPSRNNRADLDSPGFFGFFANAAHDARDEFFQLVLPPENLGAAQPAAAQKRFQRLDKPAFAVRFEVRVNGARAAPDRGSVA